MLCYWDTAPHGKSVGPPSLDRWPAGVSAGAATLVYHVILWGLGTGSLALGGAGLAGRNGRTGQDTRALAAGPPHAGAGARA